MISSTSPSDCATRHGRRGRALPPGAQRPASMLAAFCFPALAYLVAGAVCAVLATAGAGGPHAGWLSLHLVFVGGISQVLIGAGQFFSTAYLATEPPSRRMTLAQLAVWNAGALLVAAGVPADAGAVSAAGGTLLLVGLALYAVALRALERRSLQTSRWTLRWYYASAAYLAIGSLLGASMASGAGWAHGSLFGAHLACNLGGWFGGAIVGTLHTFYPSLTHSRLEHPRLQGPTFVFWYAGVGALAGGEAFAAWPLVWAGWSALSAASAMLLINIVACSRAAQAPVGLPARLVGAAQGFLVAGMIVALAMLGTVGAAAAIADPWRPALGVLLGLGWIGLTFAGSLMQLMTVLARVRDLGARLPDPAPLRDSLLAAGLSVSIALLALAQSPSLSGLERTAEILSLVFAAPVGARVLQLAARAARAPKKIHRQV